MWKRVLLRKARLSSFNKKGFTLLELILVLALLAVIVGIGAPVFQSLQNRNNLEIATVQLAQNLRRAHLFSVAMRGDSSWGVKLSSGELVLFSGENYASRDVAADEVFGLPSSMNFSGLTEVIFDKLSGEPNVSGDFILNLAGKSRIVNLNDLAVVNY